MGCDYYAVAVIGLKIDRYDLFDDPRKVKAFAHDYDESTLYDPKTGMRLWNEEDVPVEGYDEDGGTFLGYPVIHAYGADDDTFFVSALDAKGKSNRSGNLITGVGLPDDLSARIAEFRRAMEGAGMWEDEAFGLWSVLNVSC